MDFNVWFIIDPFKKVPNFKPKDFVKTDTKTFPIVPRLLETKMGKMIFSDQKIRMIGKEYGGDIEEISLDKKEITSPKIVILEFSHWESFLRNAEVINFLAHKKDFWVFPLPGSLISHLLVKLGIKKKKKSYAKEILHLLESH